MKKIFNYLNLLTISVLLFASCNNDMPEFNDKDAFVGLGQSSLSVNEDGGSISIPVTLASVKGLSASVSVETLDGTAKAGVNYILDTPVLTFTPDSRTQNIKITIINNPGVFTGDVGFSIKLGTSQEVNIGADNICSVIIADLDHPLSAILGSYEATATSYFNGPTKYVVTFTKDKSDLSKVWIDDFFGVPGWAGSDMLQYGVADLEKGTIIIPFGQESEYKYGGTTPVQFLGIDNSLLGYGSGEGNWIVEIKDGGKTLVVKDYGVWTYIPGAGSLEVLLPGITMVKQ